LNAALRARLVLCGAAGLLVVSGLAIVVTPRIAPAAVLAVVATAFAPLLAAWSASRGTALRAAVLWGMAAAAAAIVSQALACLEPLETGRPLAGHATYVASLAMLAALISVLNARTPGGGAWAILMGLLILVFLIPWLEGPSLARKAQGLAKLRLEFPWSAFYTVVVVAGVTNYLPTRYGRAAAWLGLGFGVELLGLTQNALRLSRGGALWSVFPWTLAAAAWSAFFIANRSPARRGDLNSTWLWFRDHWGVVWALRVLERFNRSAERARWPVRLGWYGVAPSEPRDPSTEAQVPPAALATFHGLLRRFAEPARLAETGASDVASSCQRSDVK
jgi:hypothetical protein